MEFVALIVAIIAFAITLQLRKRMAEQQQQISELGQRLLVRRDEPPGETDAAHVPAPPPVPEAASVAAPPPLPATAGRIDEAAIDQLITEAAPPPPPPPPPAPTEPAKSFEERFGASWVVWIGGL